MCLPSVAFSTTEALAKVVAKEGGLPTETIVKVRPAT